MEKHPTRTTLQNSAEHKYFELLANALNDSGQDMRRTLKQEIDIPWSKETVKEYLFRPLMQAMFNIDSTAKLTTKQTSQVYEALNRHTAFKLGISIPWPSNEPPMIGDNYD